MGSRRPFVLVLLLVLAACGGKKLDRAEVDRVVKTADHCATINDLIGVLQAERHIAELAKVDADVKTVEKAPPGRPPATK